MDNELDFCGFTWSVSAYHKHTATITDYIAWFHSEEEAQDYCNRIVSSSHEAFIPVRYNGEIENDYTL